MYNNPYNFYPYMNQMTMNAANTAFGAKAATSGLRRGGSLFKSLSGIKWGNVLSNTQKTLNVINQAIPVYYQIKPIWGNIKSFGKIMSALNETDNKNDKATNFTNQNQVNQINQNLNEKKEVSNNIPTFFIN